MTLRDRLFATSDPVAGSRILSYRIGRLTPCSPLIVAAQAGVPLLSQPAGRRRNRVTL